MSSLNSIARGQNEVNVESHLVALAPDLSNAAREDPALADMGMRAPHGSTLDNLHRN